MTEPKTSLDLLGIKGISDSLHVATKGCIDGAAAFLSRVCLPAAEEFGLALRDRIGAWRAANAVKMLNRANELDLQHSASTRRSINPRLVQLALDEASWIDDDEISGMWAGLLASSSTHDGKSDENLIFMTILQQLSSLQVRVLKYSVETAGKFTVLDGLPFAHPLEVPTSELTKLFLGFDLHRIDRELDHLVNIGLIGSSGSGGIDVGGGHLARLTPTSLALNLYVRAQGTKQTPAEYWKLQPGSPMDYDAIELGTVPDQAAAAPTNSPS